MGFNLTHGDINDLLNNRNVDSQLNLCQKICVSYTEKIFTQEEILIAEDIFRLLCAKAEVIVRKSLSEALKNSDELPHDIALSLAKDVMEVAIPMLEFSKVLNQEDLLEIIQSQDVPKLLAIATRADLTKDVVDELLKCPDKNIAEAVLGNSNFNMSEKDFEAYIDVMASDPNLARSLAMRASLPTVVMEKLITEVSAEVIAQVKDKYHITPEKLDKYVTHTREVSTLSVIDHNTQNAEIDHLVEHLYNYGKLNNSILLSAICMGRRRFFIAGLAKRAGIAKQSAIKLLHEGGQQGAFALFRKADIPEKLFEALELVIRLTEEKKAIEPAISVKDFAKWLIARLENFAGRTKIEYLTYLIAIAKQSQNSRGLMYNYNTVTTK
jgi:uncharacterized protein (DUF2336 family)